MAIVTTYATAADLTTVGISPNALADFGPLEQVAVIDTASRMVDGYLSSHYTLPLTRVGADVMLHTVAISVYLLMSARGYNPEAGADTNIRDRYNDAIRWLENVSKGLVHPDITDSSTKPVTGGPAAPIVISSSQRGWSNRGSLAQPPPPFPFVDD